MKFKLAIRGSIHLWIVLSILIFGFACQPKIDNRISVIIDTDANNELDDQHALAYLFFNGNGL